MLICIRTLPIIIIIIIIIMAGMAVIEHGWLPHRGEAQMAYNYAPHEDIVINKIIQNLEGKAFSDHEETVPVTWSDEKYIAPGGDRSHDLPHTVASNMVKVSHALNHSATNLYLYVVMSLLLVSLFS